MPDRPAQPRVGGQLRIWSQNLNKSLKAQTDFNNHLSPRYFDLALIQEPYFDFRNLTRINRDWIAVYPPKHTNNPKVTRAIIMVNTRLPSSTWRVVPIDSPYITAIDIFGPAFGTIRIINVYNDCEHNEAI
ncbi:hypothetical protein C8F04DRAFT_943646, partial [Mycena alexandri]